MWTPGPTGTPLPNQKTQGQASKAKLPKPVLKGSYYEILGLEQDAEQADIKSTYRTLAKKLHPDVNPSEEALNQFIEATTAYEVLNDPDLRKQYDVRWKIENQMPVDLSEHQETAFQWAAMRSTEAMEVAQRARSASRTAGRESMAAKKERTKRYDDLKVAEGGRQAKEVSKTWKHELRSLRRRATQVRAWAQWAEKEEKLARKDLEAWQAHMEDPNRRTDFI